MKAAQHHMAIPLLDPTACLLSGPIKEDIALAFLYHTWNLLFLPSSSITI
jgi:hypothetical protein